MTCQALFRHKCPNFRGKTVHPTRGGAQAHGEGKEHALNNYILITEDVEKYVYMLDGGNFSDSNVAIEGSRLL
jgi:hypothetical protein